MPVTPIPWTDGTKTPTKIPAGWELTGEFRCPLGGEATLFGTTVYHWTRGPIGMKYHPKRWILRAIGTPAIRPWPANTVKRTPETFEVLSHDLTREEVIHLRNELDNVLKLRS